MSDTLSTKAASAHTGIARRTLERWCAQWERDPASPVRVVRVPARGSPKGVFAIDKRDLERLAGLDEAA